MPKYLVLEKRVGQTPLQVVQAYKKDHPEVADIPMAYAGRLDPMASGKLLVLVGDECKKQKEYHGLDKEYRFEVMFGTSSDTGDVLGLLEWKKAKPAKPAWIKEVAKSLVGPLSLPYPKFSSKTVQGKPLHIWTLEDRLDEIEIPTAKTFVYSLKLAGLRSSPAITVYEEAWQKINSLPPVTEESKKLGADFRRQDVRISWQNWLEYHRGQNIQIATFDCVVTTGTYMRSLAEEIGRRLASPADATPALAIAIHRTTIGRYQSLPFGFGLWTKRY